MFRPEEMSEVNLLVLRRDIETVTKAIARQGVLHQVDTGYLSREEQWQSGQWQERAQEYQGIEQRILLMMGVLQAPQEATAAGQELDLGADLAELQDQIVTIERDVMPLVNTLKEQQERLAELEPLARRLQPIGGLDIELGSLRGLRFLHVQVGILPTTNLERLKASLLHVPHLVLPLGAEGAGTLALIFGSAKDRDVLERAAHSAYFSPISLPEEYRGTPRMILDRIQAEVSALQAKQAELGGQIEALREKWGTRLRSLLWRVRAALVLLKAMDRFGQVRDVYLVTGWVPKRKLPLLTDQVGQATDGRVIIDVASADHAADIRSVPVTLNNRGLLRAFQSVVTTYSWPAYDEIDPTPLVAVTFSIMFGVMFGDVGHGLVLALAGGLIMSGWLPALKGFARMAPLFLLSGICAMFFGVLDGSVFGVEGLFRPLWLRPLENITTVLLATIVLGVVIQLIGFLVNMINGWLARDWRRVLFDRYGLAGMWFYLAVIAIVLSLVRGIRLPTLLIAGLILPPVLLILLGEPLGNLIGRRQPLIHDSVGLFLVQSLFEFFEALISYLSSSLSYVRLGAFAVAHAGLSAVVMILAGMAGGPASPLYWVVLLLGNIFIIGFEGLIVGIQTLRLEYYEFFSKFFSGGGVPYRPFTLAGKSLERQRS